MTTDRLASALTDRYRAERELGAGGKATVRQPRTANSVGAASRRPGKRRAL